MRRSRKAKPAAAVTANGLPKSDALGGAISCENNISDLNAQRDDEAAFWMRKGTMIWATRQEILQRQLPYGLWVCADGREVLFIAIIARFARAIPARRFPR